MKSQWLILVAMTLFVAADDKEEAKKEAERMQGTWKVQRARRGHGVDASLVGATVVLDGDRFTSQLGDTVLGRGTWKVDPTRKPKTIDLDYTEGPTKGETMKGIYQTGDQTLVILFSGPGKDRPRSFEDKAEDHQLFLTLQAAKKCARLPTAAQGFTPEVAAQAIGDAPP